METFGRTSAFAYLRVSGKGQVDGDGFPRQLDAIERYAKQHDIHVVQEFSDKGVSGAKDLANRPAFLKMMAALHSNGTRLVLIEKLDRLARDLMVQETIIGDLRKNGVQLISVLEPDLLQDDPTRKLMRQIFGAIAEYDKTMTVLKLRVARQRIKDKTGRCEGRKPFGSWPGEAAIVDEMRKLHNEGWTFQRIATHMNASGVRTRDNTRAKVWYPATVQKAVARNLGA